MNKISVRNALWLSICIIIVSWIFAIIISAYYQDWLENLIMNSTSIGIGFTFGLLIFVVSNMILGPIIHAIIPESIHQGIEVKSIFNDMNYLPLWIFIGIFFGGFLEELERIFILTRFEKCFGKIGLIFSLIASSVFFGIGHLYEGFGSMISIGIAGFLYALVYLRKRSALEPVIAHATYNTVGLIIGAIIYN